MQNTFILTSELFLIFNSSNTVQTLFKCMVFLTVSHWEKINKQAFSFQLIVVQGKLLILKSRNWGTEQEKVWPELDGTSTGHEGRAIRAPCSTRDDIMSHVLPMKRRGLGILRWVSTGLQDPPTMVCTTETDPKLSDPWVFILLFVKCRCPFLKNYQIYIPAPLLCP